MAAVQAAARGEAGHLALGFTESSTYATMIPEIVAELRRRHEQEHPLPPPQLPPVGVHSAAPTW